MDRIHPQGLEGKRRIPYGTAARIPLDVARSSPTKTPENDIVCRIRHALDGFMLAKPFAAMIVCFICSCRRLRIGTRYPDDEIASGWAAQIFAACDVVSVAKSRTFQLLQTRCRKRRQLAQLIVDDGP